MAIKAVIFDIGGVLLDSDRREQDTKQDTGTGLQRDAIFKFIARSGLGDAATRGKISTQELWACVGEQFKVNQQQILDSEAKFIASERLNTELAEFLQSLRPRYKTVMLSNAWPGTREALVQRYGLDKLADSIIFSYEEGTMKPEAKIYQLALMRLRVQGNETVFLDDRVVNVDGASLLGMHSIHYRDNEQAIRDIKRVLDTWGK